MSESKSTVEQLHAEYPALVNLDARKIGKRLGDAMFWETVKVCKECEGTALEQAIDIVTEWANSDDMTPDRAKRVLLAASCLNVPAPEPF